MKPGDRELITGQLEKAREKLDAARILARDDFHDDAVSRAYYSMFHAASAVLLSLGITADSHSALKTMFGLHLVKSGKVDVKYGKWLGRLKDDSCAPGIDHRKGAGVRSDRRGYGLGL